MRILPLFFVLATLAIAQNTAPVSAPTSDPAVDPAYGSLTRAFDALRVHAYDAAIESFRKAAVESPGRSDIRKNLAYALLKTGDTDQARGEFGEAMRLDPSDFHVALEYAFLCFEAKDDAPARKAEARRIFASIRESGDADSRATAASAFQNIDEPLRAGIARWQQALATSPPTFSAHFELAQLAEQRDELDIAVSNYKAAFRLLPERKSVLLDLARAEKSRGNTEGMIAALLAASRGPEPRASELAREALPERYPYVYEFRQALELDPGNDALHKELAYLLLRMSESGQVTREAAEQEFAVLTEATPDDYVSSAQLGMLYLEDQQTDLAMKILNRVLRNGPDQVANRVRMALHMPLVLEERKAEPEVLDARVLAERSYAAGFMKDALRYYTLAHDANPADPAVALKLGWTNNLLHDDAAAVRWFDVARRSGDPAIAREAQHAWSALQPDQGRIRTTVWLYPIFSTRWSDAFGYGQVKSGLRLGHLPVHGYASVRLAGDVRRSDGGPIPRTLSESAFVTAIGASIDSWHRSTFWFEAGIATRYLDGQHWSDYRGGLSWARTFGAALGGENDGRFFDTTFDSVYVSHFGRDLLNVSQTRIGYTMTPGGIRTQAFWGQNVTVDAKQQYWANFVEAGPGVRIHPPGLPAPVWINFSAMHGVYLRNAGNPGRPNFNDIRVGIWYAFTK
jgi:tetratricopeptide (TPR) repeat protein